jgi:hypothetical protein
VIGGTIAGVTEGMWGFFAAVVTNAVILIGLYVRQGKQRTVLDQVNRAVNHQPEGSPTLVERVVAVEERTEQLATETVAHRAWEHRVFAALAHHVGFNLPQRVMVTEFDPLLDPIEGEEPWDESGSSN